LVRKLYALRHSHNYSQTVLPLQLIFDSQMTAPYSSSSRRMPRTTRAAAQLLRVVVFYTIILPFLLDVPAVHGFVVPMSSNAFSRRAAAAAAVVDEATTTTASEALVATPNKQTTKRKPKKAPVKNTTAKGSRRPQMNSGKTIKKSKQPNKKATKKQKGSKASPTASSYSDKTSAELVSALRLDLSKELGENHSNNDENKTSSKVQRKRGTSSQTMSKPKKTGIIPLTELSIGATVSGKVVRILPFGALVQTPYDIRGEPYGCAMLHISRIADQTIKDISKVLHVGQDIHNARVVSLNRDRGTVGISLREKSKRVSLKTMKAGDEVEGTVVRMKNYGVFVDIGTKRDALLHISRMSLHRVNNISDYAKIGQTLKARVIRVNADTKDIAISLLSPENDQFIDRRERERERTALWNKVVDPKEFDDVEEAKKQLLQLDHEIREEYFAMETSRRMEI